MLTARTGVYPRPHGEAGVHRPQTASLDGLSPPTRGSPADPVRFVARLGSIPAHTGKPCLAGQ